MFQFIRDWQTGRDIRLAAENIANDPQRGLSEINARILCINTNKVGGTEAIINLKGISFQGEPIGDWIVCVNKVTFDSLESTGKKLLLKERYENGQKQED